MTKFLNFYPLLLQAQVEAINVAKGEDEGACGFAWVKISSKTDLVKWIRKKLRFLGFKYDTVGNLRDLNNSIVRTPPDNIDLFGAPGHRAGTWVFWNPGQYKGQAVYPKELGASAFAKVLNEACVEAFADSRLD